MTALQLSGVIQDISDTVAPHLGIHSLDSIRMNRLYEYEVTFTVHAPSLTEQAERIEAAVRALQENERLRLLGVHVGSPRVETVWTAGRRQPDILWAYGEFEVIVVEAQQ